MRYWLKQILALGAQSELLIGAVQKRVVGSIGTAFELVLLCLLPPASLVLKAKAIAKLRTFDCLT